MEIPAARSEGVAPMSAGQSKRLLESLRLPPARRVRQRGRAGAQWAMESGEVPRVLPNLDEPGFLVAQTRCDGGGRTELCKIWFLVNRGGASRCLGW